jgi:hypothetical protein
VRCGGGVSRSRLTAPQLAGAAAAIKDGVLAEEISPVTIATWKGR